MWKTFFSLQKNLTFVAHDGTQLNNNIKLSAHMGVKFYKF